MSTAVAERIDQAPALRIVAGPKPLHADYARLADIEQGALALYRRIVEYRAIPAHPLNDDYRSQQINTIEADMADLRKAMGNG